MRTLVNHPMQSWIGQNSVRIILAGIGAMVAASYCTALGDVFSDGQVIPGTEGIIPGPGVQFSRLQLEGAELSDVDLTGANFEQSNLTDANLRAATLIGANFQNANLTRAKVYFATLVNADLSGANLTDAVVSVSDLTNARLTDAILAGADFSASTAFGFTKEQLYSTASYKSHALEGIELNGTDLIGWDFSDQNLSGASLRSSWLWNAMLAGANLTSADLQSTKLTNANLASANLNDADLSFAEVTNVNLTRASLHGANLSGTNFDGSNLNEVDLTAANLTNAILTHAGLQNANLTDAVVSGANFSRVFDFPGLTKDQLYSTASYRARDLRRIKIENHYNLDGVDLSGQNLTEASLQSSRLTSANLTGANLAGADLSSSNLNYANFSDANLTNAKLSGSALNETFFYDAVVAGADFRRMTLRGFTKERLYSTASYQAKNLRGIQVDENQLGGWNFGGQDLTNASMQSSTLSEANFRNADLTGAKLNFSNLTQADLTGANLTNADLTRAFLTFANMTDALVVGAKFYYARGFSKEQLYATASYQTGDLRRIHLTENMSNWDFSDQNLANATLESITNFALMDFSGANLSNTVFIGSFLSNATFDSTTTYNQWTVFPNHFDVIAAGITLVPTARGDFDADGFIDVVDVDLLGHEIRYGQESDTLHSLLDDRIFDLNFDSNVNQEDLRVWVEDINQTWFGDANLDGEFNSEDLVSIFKAGQFEDVEPENSGWAGGDWNADGDFTTADLVAAFRGGGYDRGRRETPQTVPEPSSVCTLLSILAWHSCCASYRPQRASSNSRRT